MLLAVIVGVTVAVTVARRRSTTAR
jgi:hypothetical protein